MFLLDLSTSGHLVPDSIVDSCTSSASSDYVCTFFVLHFCFVWVRVWDVGVGPEFLIIFALENAP